MAAEPPVAVLVAAERRAVEPLVSSPEPGMVRAEIVLPDARLLWFYTFDDDAGDDDDVGGDSA